MADKEKPEKPQNVEILKDKVSAGDKNLVLARDVFPQELPVVPIRGRPLFPKMTVPMIIENENLRKMIIQTDEAHTKFIGLALIRDEGSNTQENISSKDLYNVGVVAEILQVAQVSPDMPAQMLLGSLERFKIKAIIQENPHIIAKVDYMHETEMTHNDELRAYAISVVKAIKELIQLNPLHKEELNLFASRSSLADPGRLADFAAALTTASGKQMQEILETISIRARLKKVLHLLQKEMDISKIQVQITKQIEEKLSKQQREFFLKEQLKAIKKELGLSKEGKESEVEKFTERLQNLKLTDEAQERVNEEIEKLKLIEPTSPEFNVSRTYVDWLTILPWGVFTADNYDIDKAAKILNRDHYGLADVKERILEFLSVGIMKGNISGSILCFVGPPGVGKTSLGQSIARSMGRNFYRFSVGGIRDEAEIKGHRRTYIGALPGKFIQTMKVCKSANPVIMLDEIDKIGASYQGDPASALLEVLDSEQNKDFLDHYLDVRFDLSNVFFICTANQLDTIPAPLLDRMEVIKLAGYILQEKMEIARRYLVPKQLKAHGVKREQVTITSEAIRDIIDGYAREPGVRGLENNIKKTIRKSVKKIVEKKVKKVRISKANIHDLLGKRIFTDESLYKQPTPGVVMGLAWTSMGGDTLFIEATKVLTGKSGFKQTGQLGDVMIESSEIAYTYVRALLSNDENARKFFAQNFIHLHVPAGATRKDGPSAGVTMATALYSLVKNKAIKKNFAMTGELSLTGLVMPIGGVKEKTIAAKRAKVVNLIFPTENKRDFDDLPAHVKKGLKPRFVSKFEQIVKICF
ncbi:MAG: endopeptidase La [Lentisphaerae bacterium]|nr:endopeptidase La [Lentisphaerota bacterium]